MSEGTGVGFAEHALKYLPRLRRYARALTGDGAAADDLVQDTLERALNKQALWREGSVCVPGCSR
jgi:DNA-directed RNA polymerase specialized sigma24 family protein